MFPDRQPPIFSAQIGVAGSREIRTRPKADTKPELLGEAAMHEQVGAVLVLERAERAAKVTGPSPAR